MIIMIIGRQYNNYIVYSSIMLKIMPAKFTQAFFSMPK